MQPTIADQLSLISSGKTHREMWNENVYNAWNSHHGTRVDSRKSFHYFWGGGARRGTEKCTYYSYYARLIWKMKNHTSKLHPCIIEPFLQFSSSTINRLCREALFLVQYSRPSNNNSNGGEIAWSNNIFLLHFMHNLCNRKRWHACMYVEHRKHVFDAFYVFMVWKIGYSSLFLGQWLAETAAGGKFDFWFSDKDVLYFFLNNIERFRIIKHALHIIG